jgi:hypothetical protein
MVLRKVQWQCHHLLRVPASRCNSAYSNWWLGTGTPLSVTCPVHETKKYFATPSIDFFILVYKELAQKILKRKY